MIKRHDLDKRGKGFALDFGVRYLAKSPPDVVVVIDADCILPVSYTHLEMYGQLRFHYQRVFGSAIRLIEYK